MNKYDNLYKAIADTNGKPTIVDMINIILLVHRIFPKIKNINTPKEYKICQYCNTEFIPFHKHNSKQIYCQHDCRLKAAYIRQKNKKNDQRL
jgi:hypothetical protein